MELENAVKANESIHKTLNQLKTDKIHVYQH